jgi:integrase
MSRRCRVVSGPNGSADALGSQMGAPTTTAREELLGHADVKTTMIYTHVLQRAGGRGVRSPLDVLQGGAG